MKGSPIRFHDDWITRRPKLWLALAISAGAYSVTELVSGGATTWFWALWFIFLAIVSPFAILDALRRMREQRGA